METCAVCLEPSDRHTFTLTCSHAFHAECVAKYMRARGDFRFPCPLCRQTTDLTVLCDTVPAFELSAIDSHEAADAALARIRRDRALCASIYPCIIDIFKERERRNIAAVGGVRTRSQRAANALLAEVEESVIGEFHARKRAYDAEQEICIMLTEALDEKEVEVLELASRLEGSH